MDVWSVNKVKIYIILFGFISRNSNTYIFYFIPYLLLIPHAVYFKEKLYYKFVKLEEMREKFCFVNKIVRVFN